MAFRTRPSKSSSTTMTPCPFKGPITYPRLMIQTRVSGAGVGGASGGVYTIEFAPCPETGLQHILTRESRRRLAGQRDRLVAGESDGR